jgi:hypothetical protein
MLRNRMPRPIFPAPTGLACGSEARDSATHATMQKANVVAVGTLITERPPHRSGQAGFPHPAPKLSE